MINFTYKVLYYITKTYVIEKQETITNNPAILIYIDKIENRIAFKIKTGYYLHFLIPKTSKLLGSTKNN